MSKTPHYMGNFRYTSPYHFDSIGVFAMTLEKVPSQGEVSEMVGTIDDVFGNASFRGTISDGGIEFKKLYSVDSIEKLGAYSTPLQYMAVRKRSGLFVGHWIAHYVHSRPGGLTTRGNFILYAQDKKKFEILYDMHQKNMIVRQEKLAR